MALFGKKQKPTTTSQEATPAPAPAGAVVLTKGNRLNLTKTGAPIVARNGWTAKGKDYDLKALIRYRDGRTLYIGAANVDELLASPEGAVRHSGDSRKAGVMESLTVAWHASIASVALSSYSALENGTGSFRKYGVFVRIENGPQVVQISAADASAKGTSYTLCFGEIIFGTNQGELTVVNHEMYSASGSENRVGYEGDRVVMDIGPVGQPKND